MKERLTFRRANPDDALLWAATRQKAWAATYRGIYPDAWIDSYDLATMADRARQTLSDPQIKSYLVMDGEVCGGYFSYGPKDAGEYYLYSLYLLPEYQRQGLGRRMFQQLARDCLAANCTRIVHHCNYHNTPARRFYEHMGGRCTGHNGFHENKAEDQCRYEYDLTKGELPWLPKPL